MFLGLLTTLGGRRIGLVALVGMTVSAAVGQTLDLSGSWQFAIDRDQVGADEQWYARPELGDDIVLPGSMTERLKGDMPTVKTVWTGSLYDSTYFFNPTMERYRQPGPGFSLPFFLTPPRDYKGHAWYVRDVEVPAGWAGRDVIFSMERPHVRTTVWVNGVELGSQSSLCVPHRYDVTAALRPGETNRIAVRVSNAMADICVGQDSHSVSDQTQGNWNGITGQIRLTALAPVHLAATDSLAAVEVYPDVDRCEARVRVHFINSLADVVRVRATIDGVEQEAVTTADTAWLTFGGLDRLWDEFTPNLYRLSVELLSPERRRGRKVVSPEAMLDRREVTFGMREVHCEGKDIVVNGRRVLLRGTVENADFPLTGYVPTDTASWMRVFRICKEWGLNHMRFHSYCPPEAAFVAADVVGFYLQAEGPSWPNHGVRMNRREPIDTFLLDETRRLTVEYGNHPSYLMLSAGNEPAGNWVPWATAFVNYWRRADPRRIYTGFTVGGGWDWQPANQYHAKAGNRGLQDWDRRRPGTMTDFRHATFKGGYEFDSLREPFVCHEMGQWCAFPDLKETSQYTGVLKAKNFEIFRDQLARQDMAGRAEPFLMASGNLQTLCYKYEIEKLRRTPGYAGYQLLALNDYSGQGTALEGVLNVFWENKGYARADEWRQYNAPVVALMRTERFVYQADEVLRFTPEISNFGPTDLADVVCRYVLTDDGGASVAHGTASLVDAPSGTVVQGCLARFAEVAVNLSELPLASPQRLRLHIEAGGAANDWNFWVYPAEGASAGVAPGRYCGRIYVADSLDAKAQRVLARGGDVLLLAGARVSYGRDIKQYFTPVFWNTSWFKMRPPHTTGIYVESQHPLFRHFPTASHSDLQWWELVNRTPVMLFSDFPEGFQPLVQSIDTWFLSRKCGILYEARVGRGRLVMTTMDLTSRLDERIVARQMLRSIVDYMQSSDFAPAWTVDMARVQDLFTQVAAPYNSYVNETPDELKPGYEKPKK